jgi:hypothetical protein
MRTFMTHIDKKMRRHGGDNKHSGTTMKAIRWNNQLLVDIDTYRHLIGVDQTEAIHRLIRAGLETMLGKLAITPPRHGTLPKHTEEPISQPASDNGKND